jgi:hypothetical protein
MARVRNTVATVNIIVFASFSVFPSASDFVAGIGGSVGAAFARDTGFLYFTDGSEWFQVASGSGSNEATIVTGEGAPEGAVTAAVGTIYIRTDGGADTVLYLKETGAGNTGWVAAINNATVTTLSALVRSGEGAPEGAVTAAIGTIYLRTDGGANTTMYVKESRWLR